MAELSDKDKQFIKELRKQHENGDLSRRQALKLGGAVGLGGLLGGGGAYTATQAAQGQASTTDDDGNVGLPNDRVDVFADGVNSNSLNTERLNTAEFANEKGGADGGEMIQQALNDASPSNGGSGVAVAMGRGPDDPSTSTGTSETSGWVLSSTLQIPSNTTLVLWDAFVFLGDGVNDNPIRNAAADSGDTTRDEDVNLIGIGNARVHGNPTNQTRTDSELYKMHGIHFYKVDGFSIRGITLGPTNAFGIAPEDTIDGHVENIEFAQDDSTDNQAGIQAMGPTEDFVGRDFTGLVGDDAFAFDTTAGTVDSSNRVAGRGSGGNVSNVTIMDAEIENLDVGGLVRLFGTSGTTFDGATVRDVHRVNYGTAPLIKLGATGFASPDTADDFKNFTFENISGISTGNPYIEQQGGDPVKNLTFKDMSGTSAGPFYQSNNKRVAGLLSIEGCDVEITTEATWINIGVMDAVEIRDCTGTFTGTSTTYQFLSPASNDEINERLIVSDTTAKGWPAGVYVGSGVTISGRVSFDFDFQNIDTPWEVSQDGIIQNGIAEESANAEEPQLSYQTGDIVDFVDSGDGSGTGVYQLLPDGTWAQIGT